MKDPESIGVPAAWKALVFLLLLAVIIVAWRILPVHEWVDRSLGPLRELGAVGTLAYVVVYVVAVVFMVPGSALSLAGGYLYGPWLGTALVSLASTLGAAAAFLVARTVARNHVRRWAEHDRRFDALDRAVSERGAWVVLLLRLSPVFPFNLLNYGLGATGVGFWPYVAASWLGMLPGTVVIVMIGATFGRDGRPEALGTWYWGAVVIATLVATLFLGRLARRALGTIGTEPGQ